MRLREERSYNVGMARFLCDRGYLNLAFSHLLYADELADTAASMKVRKN